MLAKQRVTAVGNNIITLVLSLLRQVTQIASLLRALIDERAHLLVHYDGTPGLPFVTVLGWRDNAITLCRPPCVHKKFLSYENPIFAGIAKIT